MQAIHPTAIIDPDAEIGANCTIGPFTIIGKMARIGANTEIGANCELALDTGILDPGYLEIGKGSKIRSGSIFYQNSTFGSGLQTGHRVTVREGVTAGEGLQIGTLSDIQGHCTIGDFVRLHSNVFISQKSVVGNYVWIFPYVVLTNDPHPPSDVCKGCAVNDFAIIAAMATVLPGITIGKDALVGAKTLVRRDVPENTICVGTPGKNIGLTSKIKFQDTGLNVYPWRRHFHRGYPVAVVDEWKKEFSSGAEK